MIAPVDPLHPSAVLANLHLRHIGAVNGASAEKLVLELAGKRDKAMERQLRNVIVHLRRHGVPVCATPGDGYFLASNADELNATCEFLFQRSMTSLEQVSAMKHVALPDLAGQLGLNLNTTTPTTKGDHDEPHSK